MDKTVNRTFITGRFAFRWNGKAQAMEAFIWFDDGEDRWVANPIMSKERKFEGEVMGLGPLPQKEEK